MMWLWLALGSVVSAELYRMGGKGKPFNTKYRDLGCPLVCWAVLRYGFHITAVWWVELLAGLILFGMLTTYWDFLFGEDNFFMHGLTCGLAYLPYAFLPWSPKLLWLLLARSIVLCVTMGVWSHILITKDTTEEKGRGALLVLTLPILLI